MIGQATAHRRANAFAQALEDAEVSGDDSGEPEGAAGDEPGGEHAPARPGQADQSSHGGHPGQTGHGAGHSGHAAHAADRRADPEQATLLALAAALSARPRPVMSAEAKTVQRAQLIAAMEQAVAEGTLSARVPEQRTESQDDRRSAGLRKLAPRSRLSRRLAVGGLTVGVAAGALGGVAAASTNALPGDTLYGLKRGMEDIQLDMAGSDASRGKVYLDLAATRMQEARRLMDRGRGGDLDDESVSEVRKALSGMRQEAAEGHRLLSQAYRKDGSLRPIEVLNRFSESHRQGWSDLRGKLPSQLTDVSQQVSSVFAAIDQEVAPLQPLLPQPHGDPSPSATGDDRGTGSGYGSGSGSTTGTPTRPSTPTTSGTAQDPTQGGSQSPTPSPSGTTSHGLIGGSGLLEPDPTTGTDTSTPTPIPTDPQHSVILPPLLPGLLPGLGLGGEDETTP